MSVETPRPARYVGLDVHKHYLVAYAVDEQLHVSFGPQRVSLAEFEAWRQKWLTHQDAVVLEMTTNSFQLHDDLVPHVHSVTVVHPPHVALITRARVMTDKIAARVLAQLHAKGMLAGIWVPPQPVRQRRALLAQRSKMVRLSTQAKNRLHAVLHRHHLLPPEGDLFGEANRTWWLELPVDTIERVRIQSDLDTLAFAQSQIANLEQCLLQVAAQDERVLFLVQTTGISVVSALTLLAAIGDIERLEPRLGCDKAIVALARRLLVVIWHTLHEQAADHHAQAERVARELLQHAHKLGKANRRPGQTTAQYVREQLGRLGIGRELEAIPWTKKRIVSLPPSSLGGGEQ